MAFNKMYVSLAESIAPAVAVSALLLASGTALAQQSEADPSTDYLEKLKTCQTLTDDGERLACFDASVGEIVSANEAGDVRIIDKEDVRQARRELFGLSVPEVGILKGDEKEDKEARELLETSIKSVRYLSSRKIQFTTDEGAVWQINRAPTRLRTIEAGDSVIFKKASLGTYFIRIDGQLGVKGTRVR